MGQFIWQQKDWPHLTWQSEEILEALGAARKLQGSVIAQAKLVGLESGAE